MKNYDCLIYRNLLFKALFDCSGVSSVSLEGVAIQTKRAIASFTAF
ncbi:MAG: hypothetical protein KME22_20490 [Hassallia sp. WJT32-NPBG1]|nr:hypothetical protein [Hassallia sp. WJT32-NPBG1]